MFLKKCCTTEVHYYQEENCSFNCVIFALRGTIYKPPQPIKRTHLSRSNLQSSLDLFSCVITVRISDSWTCDEHSHELRAEIKLSVLEVILLKYLYFQVKRIHTLPTMCAVLNRLFPCKQDHCHYILYTEIFMFQLCRSKGWCVRG